MNRLLVILLASGAFLTGTAEFVAAGILPAIAKDLNISLSLAGQLITAYSLAFAIGTPIVVSVTSRMGRKEVVMGALALFVLGSMIAWMSDVYLIQFVARLILGLSAGIYSVVAVSSIAKLVPPEKMGSSLSAFALAFGAAMTLGVPIGIAIAAAVGWKAIFALLGVFSLIVLLLLLRLLPQIEGDEPVPFVRQFSVVKKGVIVSGLCITFFFLASNSLMLTYLTPFLQNVLHLEMTSVGIVMSALGMIGIIGSRIGGIGVDKWGSVPMLAATLLLSVVTLGLLPAAASWLYAGLFLIGLWFSSVFMNAPALNAYFIQQAPSFSNLVLGINLSVVHLGNAFGAGIGGILVEATSTVFHHAWVAGCLAAISVISALVSFAWRRKGKVGKKKEASMYSIENQRTGDVCKL